jgi:hypothetical protein
MENETTHLSLFLKKGNLILNLLDVTKKHIYSENRVTKTGNTPLEASKPYNNVIGATNDKTAVKNTKSLNFIKTALNKGNDIKYKTHEDEYLNISIS